MDVLMFGDPRRSPDLRHAVPISSGDPFIYVERHDRRTVFCSSLELPRVGALRAFDVVSFDDLGLDELRSRGLPVLAVRLELLCRACELLGTREAVVPTDFPLVAADALRARGTRVTLDPQLAVRRRTKTNAEIEGARRAAGATCRAMQAISERLRTGRRVTCETLRTVGRQAAAEADASFEVMTVAHGSQSASPHESGSGRVEPNEPIVVDLGVRDLRSGVWSDMTRTFCLGDPSARLLEFHRVCRVVHERVTPMVRPGASCAALHREADALIAGAGYPTMLTKGPGTTLASGFFHNLGHGVGLELHEPPSLGPGGDELVVGDVITIEPGIYEPGFGGCRLENLVLVTGGGHEVLTDFSFDL
jgi:Xaa-Pro aminopeptidase